MQPTILAFLGLLSLATSAPPIQGHRSGGQSFENVVTGTTGAPLSRVRAANVPWNDTLQLPQLPSHDSGMLLPPQYTHPSERSRSPGRTCSYDLCRNGPDKSLESALTAQHESHMVNAGSTSTQFGVSSSENYGIEPSASAKPTGETLCVIEFIHLPDVHVEISTVWVTETVVIAPTFCEHSVPSTPSEKTSIDPVVLSSPSSSEAPSKGEPVENYTSSASGTRRLPVLPSSEPTEDVGLQSEPLSIVTIFETFTVIPLPVPSEGNYEVPQQDSSLYTSSPSSTSEASTATQRVMDRSDPSPFPIVPPPPIKHASGSSVIVPVLLGTNLHGASSNQPSTQYINAKSPPVPQLPANLLVSGFNGALSTNYPISPDTGILDVNTTTRSLLTSLDGRPYLSRDGGRGGYLNGQHLFVFSDTDSYTTAGDFVGFVSSSVASDKYMKGLFNKPLVLEDGIGQWSDKVGRLRGFAPMTTGEQSYNIVMQGRGQRYAIRPESSLIPFNQTHGLMYAPIIYDDVNMKTQATNFTYTGNTLLVVTAGGEGGPRADRIVKRLFGQDEIAWGVFGGLRSYGPSGASGDDGRVYVFGSGKGGLLVGRVDAGQIASRGSYEYWTGTAWSPTPSPTAYFIPGAFKTGDLFYSPTHLTFLFIYLTPNADNTFYYRYLQAPSAILPSTTSDFAENIVRYKWSEEMILYKAPPGPNGKFVYAGGVQMGYYGVDDVTNGGKKAMLSWTGIKSGKNGSEYAFITAETYFD
ncbi:MAG: hypothetical protein M1839_007125 [Geoglossum umbratile]|nr:MAG: hypothetical protein M1839_007125 [Geoglossum umbratile]